MRRVKCTYNRYVSDDEWEPTDAEGYFQTWGVEYEELGDNVGNSTVAIVELDDGSIVKTLPENIKFITPAQYTRRKSPWV